MVDRGLWGAVLGAVMIATLAEARTALVKERARLREGSSAQSEFLAWIDSGTRVDILAENAGWMQVEAPGGRRGYIWGEHLTPEPEGRKPPEAGGAALLDEVRALRAEVAALRERGEGSGGSGDVERLRAEVDRLAAVQRDLVRRLDDRPAVVPLPDAPVEGGSGSGSLIVVLVVGALVGWGVRRLARRGRDRRQRNRLRF